MIYNNRNICVVLCCILGTCMFLFVLFCFFLFLFSFCFFIFFVLFLSVSSCFFLFLPAFACFFLLLLFLLHFSWFSFVILCFSYFLIFNDFQGLRLTFKFNSRSLALIALALFLQFSVWEKFTRYFSGFLKLCKLSGFSGKKCVVCTLFKQRFANAKHLDTRRAAKVWSPVRISPDSQYEYM